ncbi:MAG: efflux transporter outer membrane subunit [Gemmatimonadaceae bacterium]|nr:efflux transporter outer membrane subunit [Gemmatimonadaceae bacterium]
MEDSLRPFFDSLARSRDSAARAPRALLSDTAANLQWFALFQDTVLQKLVETAVRENRDVRVAVATIEEFRAEYGVARGPLFPQLDVTAQAGKEKIIFGGTQPFTFNVFNVAGNVAWELDFWGRLRRSAQAARADLLAQEANERAVVLSLVSDVAVAYLQLRQLDLNLEIARQTLASRQRTLQLATRRYSQGLISELDVRQFEAEVADPAARVADFERQIAQLENQLSVLLGHHPGPIPRGRSLPDVLSTIDIPAGLPSQLLERRPDVRAAEQSLAAATARIGVAQGARFPRFTITGQYGSQSTELSRLLGRNTDTYQLFFGISLPLFTGGQLSNDVRAARARAEQARYRYEQTVLQALQDVEDALAAVRSGRDQVVAQQTQVNALQRALHLATERYEEGVSSYLDVLDAQRSLFTAQLALTQAQLQALVDAVQLYKALGGGWTTEGGPPER